MQEVRTRRRTDSRRSEGGASTPGRLSPLPSRLSLTASTPSSPTPSRLGNQLSKSTDSHLHVIPLTSEKARLDFNDAGEAVTSSSKPSEEKRRSPFLGRRSFGGRAKILVEQDLPKRPRVKIERAPEVHDEEQKRHKRFSGEDEVFVEITSKLESCPERRKEKRASPERKEKQKFTELLVGTENLDTELCIVENIAIEGGRESEQAARESEWKEKKEQMKMDVRASGEKRPATERKERDGKRTKTDELTEKKAEEMGATAVLKEEEEEKEKKKKKKKKKKRGQSPEDTKTIAVVEEEAKEKKKEQSSEEKIMQKAAISLRKDEEETEKSKNATPKEERAIEARREEKDMKSNVEGEKEGKEKRLQEEAEKKKKDEAVAMETGDSQSFVTMTAKSALNSGNGTLTTSQWDYSFTSDYSSLNSSTSSARTLNSVHTPHLPFDTIVRSINIEDEAALSTTPTPGAIMEMDEQLEPQPSKFSKSDERGEITLFDVFINLMDSGKDRVRIELGFF